MTKKKLHYILFDFDGTITESAPGITKSVQYALASVGIEVPDPKTLLPFVGPPLTYSFRTYYGLSDSEIEHCIDVFHERYDTIGMYENSLYEGADTMLHMLRERGYYLAVASSKPQRFIDALTEHFGIADCFSLKVGAKQEMHVSQANRHTDKVEIVAGVLQAIMDEEGISADEKDRFLGRCAMVGDRMYDMEGAIANGILPVGAVYGYGSRQELVDAGAVLLADSVMDLPELFG